ncbi:MAG: hypothetical protein IKO30_04230 [Lachnospiraceae bacterium]|nr:hypothetical protein [Lachnospiraceae bacterium]
MANLSVPKVLWSIIYIALPAFLLLCPDLVNNLLLNVPEEFRDYVVPGIIGLFALIGFFFIRSSKKPLPIIVMIILMIGAIVVTAYFNWDKYTERFDKVHEHYQASEGEYYDKDSSEFQAKMGQMLPLIGISLPDLAKWEWAAMILPMLLWGLLGIKGVLEFAAIPKSTNKNTYADKDIPEDLQAQTNRPTEQQRAAKLASIKSSSGPSPVYVSDPKPTEPIQATQASPAPAKNTKGVIMPSWETGSDQPVIKTSNANVSSNTASPFAYEEQTAPMVPPVKPAPAPAPEPVPAAPVYTEPAPAPAPNPVPSPAPVPAPEPVPAPAPAPAPVEEAPVPPAPPAPDPIPEPAVNPFENIASPFSAVIQAVNETAAEPAPAPAPEPAPAADPFAGIASPFGNSYSKPEEQPKTVKINPAADYMSQPAPAAAPAQPVEAAKVILNPSPAVAKARAARVAQANKDQISDNEKARIKDLQGKVLELKTLYNQGMITQDEYITQRTALLQEMYTKK